MQIPIPRSQQRCDRRVAVAEVRLGRRAQADASAVLGEEVELGVVRVRGVDDGRARAEAAGPGEQLDRPHAVLGEALLDLARLLVGVHVQGQALGRGVAADLLEPVGRAGADGVGGDADAHALLAQRLDLAQKVRRRRLARAREPSARVRGEQHHQLDPGLRSRLGAASASSRPR